MEYNYFYKRKLDIVNGKELQLEVEYDLIISAYNEAERVKAVFSNLPSKVKHILILPEYEFNFLEKKSFNFDFIDYSNDERNEGEIILDYYLKNQSIIDESKKIAIDITGFLLPYIVYIVMLFKNKGITSIDFIYSEPDDYVSKEDTKFSDGVSEIRNIKGCSGTHNPETNDDYLLMGVGYDYFKIKAIAKEKTQSTKIQMLGFPSLQADMFQQNILKSYDAQEEASSGDFDLASDEVIFAPANDPFVTAEVIHNCVKKIKKNKQITNLYLCPLSTKAQALGFALFYSFECQNAPVSIIFPFSKRYSKTTSKGISSVWFYSVEFIKGEDLIQW